MLYLCNTNKQQDIMTKEDKEYIKSEIMRLFQFMDMCYSDRLAEKMLPAVVKDIEETADPEEWHTGDIEIAVRRVLLKKFRIEE